MKLSEQFRNALADEFRLVAERMKQANHPVEKAYYYSAAYGMAYRIVNLDYDPTLLFVHHVLHTTHGMLSARANEAVAGQNPHLPFLPAVADGIADKLAELAEAVQSGADVYTVLQDIVQLAYVCSGNGYYLLQKRMIPLDLKG